MVNISHEFFLKRGDIYMVCRDSFVCGGGSNKFMILKVESSLCIHFEQ